MIKYFLSNADICERLTKLKDIMTNLKDLNDVMMNLKVVMTNLGLSLL